MFYIQNAASNLSSQYFKSLPPNQLVDEVYTGPSTIDVPDFIDVRNISHNMDTASPVFSQSEDKLT